MLGRHRGVGRHRGRTGAQRVEGRGRVHGAERDVAGAQGAGRRVQSKGLYVARAWAGSAPFCRCRSSLLASAAAVREACFSACEYGGGTVCPQGTPKACRGVPRRTPGHASAW